MDQPDTVFMHNISDAKMQAMISHLRPDRELYSGRKFFEKLFEFGGTDAVMDFVNRASAALDRGDGLDLYYHFNDVEKDAFHKARLRFLSRREFCGTTAVATAGALFGLKGITSGARHVRDATITAPKPNTGQDMIDRADHAVDVAYPVAEVLISAALFNEAYEKRIEIKLEQIADAVEELQLKMQKDAAKTRAR